MTGVAAVFHRDNRPADPALVDRVLAAAPYRATGAHTHVAGAIAVGAGAREALSCHDGVAVVFDGCLHDVAGLRRQLPEVLLGRPMLTDADLVLAAYLHWADAAFDRLLGDFAIVASDSRTRRLLCVRDIVGVKPLYYYCDERLFVCASEPQQVLAALPATPDVNVPMVAEHLTMRVMHQTETLFQGLHHVPAASVLAVSGSTEKLQRFYEPPSRTDIRYRTDDEYAMHFRELLLEAIRCRLDGSQPLAAYLSGGIDSSAVVGLLEHGRRQGTLSVPALHTVTMTAPGRPFDETAYAREVARQWQLSSSEFEAGVDDAQIFIDQVRHYRDVPEYPNVVSADRLVKSVRDSGARVVLTGLGGDDWLCASFIHLPELLLRGRFREFIDVLRWENEQEFRGGWFKPIALRGIWPLLPRRVQRAVNVVRGRRAVPAPPLFTPAFAAETDVVARTTERHPRACATRSRQEIYGWLFDARLPYSIEIEDRHHAWFGVEARHPFYDRRVIEFLLSIPEDQRWRGTETKFILRRAASDVLPPMVRQRTTKGDYSHVLMQALDVFGGARCFESLEMAKLGWVDGRQVIDRYRAMRAAFERGDESYSLESARLWNVVGLELWLRHGRG